jgi:hypothetical protein
MESGESSVRRRRVRWWSVVFPCFGGPRFCFGGGGGGSGAVVGWFMACPGGRLRDPRSGLVGFGRVVKLVKRLDAQVKRVQSAPSLRAQQRAFRPCVSEVRKSSVAGGGGDLNQSPPSSRWERRRNEPKPVEEWYLPGIE